MPQLEKRARARAVALQLLFQHDHNANVPRAVIEAFAEGRVRFLRDPRLASFSLGLYDGVIAHLDEIDRSLGAAAENWRLPRMAAVDRNVLRLGAFELLFAPDTPASVAIDEAIELARRYGAKDSPGFVNGVLDRLRQTKDEGQRTKDEIPPVAPP
jgi:transcription antitermination protein NusB